MKINGTEKMLRELPDMWSIVKIPEDYGVEDMNGCWGVLQRGGKYIGGERDFKKAVKIIYDLILIEKKEKKRAGNVLSR